MDLLVLAKKTNVVLSLLVTVAKDVSLRLENYRIALSPPKCTDCSDLQSKSVVFGWLQHSLFQFSLEHSFQLQDDVQNRRDDSGPGGHPGPNEGNLKQWIVHGLNHASVPQKCGLLKTIKPSISTFPLGGKEAGEAFANAQANTSVAKGAVLK